MPQGRTAIEEGRVTRRMIELYQAEWCPHSHPVRQRLTELGLDFVARQNERYAERADAARHRQKAREEWPEWMRLQDELRKLDERLGSPDRTAAVSDARRLDRAWHDGLMTARAGTRLLIATGEAAASVEELPPLVRSLIENASELHVMTPMLVGRLQWLASDTDRARYEADERLSTVLGHVEALAPEAGIRGRIGDDAPLTAFADAIREFHPDHILIALRGSDHSGWQERGLIDQVVKFGVPITVFALDRAGRSPRT
jgi:hypothetical protein